MNKNSSVQNTTLELAHKACVEGFDTSKLMECYISQLSALFESIKKIDGIEHSTINNLSDLGMYLCEDWGSSAATCAEELEKHVNTFHEALFPKKPSNE